MPRPLRQNVPGIHHVWARGNERRDIFRDDFDRETYLVLLGHVVAHLRSDCLAFCLMDNHVHLLLEVFEPNLGPGVQRLHGLYALTFNERHGRTGHLFEGRFGSRLVTSDEQLWHTIAYIARNPVEAGLCRSPAEWRWSSHARVASRTPAPWFDEARVFRCFEGAGGDPRERYAQLVG